MKYCEIRNNYIFGPAVEANVNYDDDLFAGITIDGWQTDDDDEQGCVIATVLMSKHRDLLVTWHDNSVRMDKTVNDVIQDAKRKLINLWDEHDSKTHSDTEKSEQTETSSTL